MKIFLNSYYQNNHAFVKHSLRKNLLNFGCPVCASDLRAGAALIIAGIAAQGETEVSGIEFVDRGYENIEEKFNLLGANITRIHE